ncbi:hypothetical protein HMI56_005966 [Coelomomyces lativittatus]|nr:hypothetical protein HMI56_005966 [Coelomomyces lativittatus]
MSFLFDWPHFSKSFIDTLSSQLTTALNQTQKPSNIVNDIDVVDLHLGTVFSHLNYVS